MSIHFSLTILIENSVNARGLMAEHGWAVWIQAGAQSLLFDTGQSQLLQTNAQTLGVSLQEVRSVVLSHGHFDHTGGLETILAASPQARVFVHPAARVAKYARRDDGRTVSAGMPVSAAQALRKQGTWANWTTDVTEVAGGVFVTGKVPRLTPFEDTGGRFFLDEQCSQPDPLTDDQALFFQAKEGIVVILGCAHAGVVNILHHIRQITGGKPIHTVLGGMHLLNAKPERIEQTIEAFQQLGVQRLGPAHCTGTAATARLWTAFPGRCFGCSVGTRLEFAGL
jgi:7,8-dihydropterin-6-yl-methyl-4-(beta-D-ribofuranosyl)aminobenzene 5'-phosphate synthase